MVERWLERNTRIIEVAGSTMAEAWKMPHNAPYRAKYGEEYSDDAYRAQSRDLVFGIDMVKIPDDPAKKCYNFKNNDHKNNEAIKEINKLLGLEDVEIDKAAVEAVNMKRMENLNLSKWNDEFEEVTA